jgi:hypothetical protein
VIALCPNCHRRFITGATVRSTTRHLSAELSRLRAPMEAAQVP